MQLITLNLWPLCGVQSEAIIRIYKQVVQPVLLYGMDCVFQNKKSIQSLDTAQGNIYFYEGCYWYK